MIYVLYFMLVAITSVLALAFWYIKLLERREILSNQRFYKEVRLTAYDTVDACIGVIDGLLEDSSSQPGAHPFSIRTYMTAKAQLEAYRNDLIR